MDGGSFRLCYDGFPAFLCSSSTYFVTRTKWPHKFYVKERKKEKKNENFSCTSNLDKVLFVVLIC